MRKNRIGQWPAVYHAKATNACRTVIASTIKPGVSERRPPSDFSWLFELCSPPLLVPLEPPDEEVADDRVDGRFQYLRIISLACSAMPYVEDIRCVDRAIGGTLASATRTLANPYTRRFASTTPPCSRGSMAQDEEGWNSVLADLRTHASQSSSLWTEDPGEVSLVKQLFNGPVLPKRRASLRPSRSISKSGLC